MYAGCEQWPGTDGWKINHKTVTAYIASQKHEGWVEAKNRYDDGGRFGATIERPALQALLSERCCQTNAN